MILASLVTPAEVMENQPMLDLLWHARFRWRLRPRQVTGDTKYGTLENIRAIEDAGMRAYFNRENKHGTYYGSSRFIYDAAHDQCSQEQVAQDGNRFRKAEEGRSAPVSAQVAPIFPLSGKDSFEAFLAACCEFHPFVWCRSSDLWQSYEHWVEERIGFLTLSRMAFTQQLQEAGCRTDRTNRVGTWRGIILVGREM